MKKWISILVISFLYNTVNAQTPKSYTSSEILLQLKKLNVLGSVLYIAAHPDDENTRLLAYLANEKLYRTGYLSLTRGDGGQNLIGDEQGIDLGLIRTQELLSARRIDGAEQFFSSAYDFGFCKSTEEAIKTWGHDKILGDIVWVIRKFRPDVIITRFPGDNRAGHGHHSASAVLAAEAFDAAADANKFPEQLKQGVTVWKATRLLWNSYNFGSNNTTSEDQFKTDVGIYNPLLGKGYGEIAALSRSQHKSQGFGVPAQRGTAIEYFATIKGDKPVNDLFDAVSTEWHRAERNDRIVDSISQAIKNIITNFSEEEPQRTVSALVKLYGFIGQVEDAYWKTQKQKEIQQLIEMCSGLFIEATASSQYAVQGDSLKINFTVNDRTGVGVTNALVNFEDLKMDIAAIKKNDNTTVAKTVLIKADEKLTQPYWLEQPMTKGSFTVTDQQLIGKAENDPVSAAFTLNIYGSNFTFIKPVRYKFTDPVKGEIYQPVYIVPQVVNNITPAIHTVNYSNPGKHNYVTENLRLFTDGKNINKQYPYYDTLSKLSPGSKYSATKTVDIIVDKNKKNQLTENKWHGLTIKEINYDHIPSIKYFQEPKLKVLVTDMVKSGINIGYIAGAGDKVPDVLSNLGYKVTFLSEKDLSIFNTPFLQSFDAIITGVRAYNTNEWLGNKYEVLKQYVNNGGTLLIQYNTNNNLGPVKIKMTPYPFTISRNRITDEDAKVKFLLPDHPVLNYPNKITEKDFEGWIQERSIYNATEIDSNYQRILSMKDPGEEEQDGSLIVADYGKGRIVYTGLVFFRELPAGVPGAYRLFANLIAKRKK